MNAVTRAKDLMKAAAAHEVAGRYRDAGKMCRRAVSVLRRAGAGKTARRWLLRSLNALACVLEAEGRDAETEPILKEATVVKDFLVYDPAPALRRVRCPVLSIIGTKDLQVAAEENNTAIR